MTTQTPNYAAPATITMDLASLASSSTLVAGRESTAVDNSTNKYLDALVSGSVTVGTGPAANTIIAVFAYAQHDDTPTYQDVLDGTDSAETFTSAGVMAGITRLLGVLSVDTTTSDRVYYLAPTSVAQLFGGVLPKRWGLFVAQSTGAALKSSGNTDTFKYAGVKFDAT